jgi:hypothetical protein
MKTLMKNSVFSRIKNTIVKYSTGQNRFQQNGKQKSGRLYYYCSVWKLRTYYVKEHEFLI